MATIVRSASTHTITGERRSNRDWYWAWRRAACARAWRSAWRGLNSRPKAYLEERELVSYAYRAMYLPLATSRGEVSAYTFVADSSHPQYAGELSTERAAQIIIRARGRAGLNRDYLVETLRRIEAEGFADQRLHELLKRVEYLTGLLEAGGGI